MRKNKKILILSVNFGLGHVMVANSIKECLEEYDRNLKVSVADIYEIISPRLNSEIYKGYEFLVKKMHEVYNYFYYKRSSMNQLVVDQFIYNLYLSRISKYIEKEQPSLIVSTFPICSGFVSMYKKKNKSSIPLITCITDVVDNCEWIYTNTARYLVATDKIKDKYIKRGIKEEIIKTTGIPVRKDFFNTNQERKIARRFNIRDNDFVILMMGGGIGLLPEDEEFYLWMDNLEGVKTIVLTGNNRSLYKRLTEKIEIKSIIALGITDKVPELMSISNILVTKAGGVSIFEAINSNLPLIAYKPILGQEIENGKFILESGIGEIAQNLEELKKKIIKYLNNDSLRYRFKENLETIKGNIDTLNIAKYILEACNDSEKAESAIYL